MDPETRRLMLGFLLGLACLVAVVFVLAAYRRVFDWVAAFFV